MNSLGGAVPKYGAPLLERPRHDETGHRGGAEPQVMGRLHDEAEGAP